MKAELRRVLIDKRRRISKEDQRLFSQRAFDRLVSFGLVRKAPVIVAYMAFDAELSLEPLLQWALDTGRRIALPCFRDGKYVLAFVTDLNRCVVGQYGILEPPEDAVVLTDAERINVALWLVPGVAFTKNGIRLGYGKGVYDKLLRGVFGYRMGVCYPFQIVDFLPAERHDIAMDFVLDLPG